MQLKLRNLSWIVHICLIIFVQAVSLLKILFGFCKVEAGISRYDCSNRQAFIYLPLRFKWVLLWPIQGAQRVLNLRLYWMTECGNIFINKLEPYSQCGTATI
jgi:hypothetical protein